MAENDPYEDYEELTPAENIERKRLIVCCDGTGQSATQDGEATVPTNVTRFARALQCSDRWTDEGVAKEIPQIVLYQTGVGTGGLTRISDGIAGAFGYGVDLHVLEAYSFYSNNFEKGDELFLFGFSRGAFTARAIASLICNVGLLEKKYLQYLPMIYKRYKKRRSSKEERDSFDSWFEQIKSLLGIELHQNVEIHHLGLWDTVGSLGIPRTWISLLASKVGLDFNLNKRHDYHDTSFPIPKEGENWKGFVIGASQALSIDETRISFSPTLLYAPYQPEEQRSFGHGTGFSQVWFPGVHTDVGGGYERSYKDISDITLAWMVDRCEGRLKFRWIRSLHEELRQPSQKVVDPLSETEQQPASLPPVKGWALSDLHDEANSLKFKLGGAAARTPGQYFLDKVHDELGTHFETHEEIHVSVRMRMMEDPTWRPAALAGFQLQRHDDGFYYWHKIVKRKGKEPKEIILPEWGFNNGARLGSRLLNRDEMAKLNDIKRNREIEMVPEIELGWAALLPWNWGTATWLVASSITFLGLVLLVDSSVMQSITQEFL